MTDTIEITVKPGRVADMAVARIGGATLEEIAAVYGLTRERVRQLLKDSGLDQFQTPFKGDPTSDVQANLRNRVLNKGGSRRRAAKHRRRMEDIRLLRELAASLERTPTVREYAQSRELLPPDIYARWASRFSGKGSSRHYINPGHGMQRLYHLAGLEVRGKGSAGHVDQGAMRKRGAAHLRKAQKSRTLPLGTQATWTPRGDNRWAWQVRKDYPDFAICGPDGCNCAKR